MVLDPCAPNTNDCSISAVLEGPRNEHTETVIFGAYSLISLVH